MLVGLKHSQPCEGLAKLLQEWGLGFGGSQGDSRGLRNIPSRWSHSRLHESHMGTWTAIESPTLTSDQHGNGGVPPLLGAGRQLAFPL